MSCPPEHTLAYNIITMRLRKDGTHFLFLHYSCGYDRIPHSADTYVDADDHYTRQDNVRTTGFLIPYQHVSLSHGLRNRTNLLSERSTSSSLHSLTRKQLRAGTDDNKPHTHTHTNTHTHTQIKHVHHLHTSSTASSEKIPT